MPQLRGIHADPVLSPLGTYLREINPTPLLSPQEEKDLAHRIAQGDAEARDQLARANLRLVVRVARSYVGRGLGLQDLIEEGNLGLLRAVEGFDPGMNTRFSTFARFWIKESIRRALARSAKTIRLPDYVDDLLAQWHRATSQFQGELGRAPTDEEVARRLNLSQRKLAIVKKAMTVYKTGQLANDYSLEDVLSDDRDKPPDTRLIESETLHYLLEGLDKLNKRHAIVLSLRFGLDQEGVRTLREIGALLGVSRTRALQIESEALVKLRALMETG
jgi:RNA polymerase primary sigma factor